MDTVETKAFCYMPTDYPYTDSLQSRVDWLRRNGEDLCYPQWYDFILDGHRIPGTATINSVTGTFTTDWTYLNGLISGISHYGAYLTFDKNLVGTIIGLRRVASYFDAPYCFSVALMRAIEYHIIPDRNTIFEFSFAKINGRASVLVRIIQPGSTTTYLDYTDEPRKDEEGNDIEPPQNPT